MRICNKFEITCIPPLAAILVGRCSRVKLRYKKFRFFFLPSCGGSGAGVHNVHRDGGARQLEWLYEGARQLCEGAQQWRRVLLPEMAMSATARVNGDMLKH